MDIRIISIGALSKNECITTDAGGRTPHATSTLIQVGDRKLLVDPGLPEQALAIRLQEQAGISPDAITDVFLTNFRPAHRRGLPLFTNATIWIFENEREISGQYLIARFQKEQEESADEEILDYLRQEIAILKDIKAAPDSLMQGVDLFPLPGYTPGCCGLLLTQENITTLIAGDAIPTQDHLMQARILKGAQDIEAAQASLEEALGVADWFITGHGNIVPSPVRHDFAGL